MAGEFLRLTDFSDLKNKKFLAIYLNLFVIIHKKIFN